MATPETPQARFPLGPLSLVADLLYGSIPTPTFQLPDKRLQPDFLMDTFPSWLFFLVSFGMVAGLEYAVYSPANILWIACAIPVLVHWILFFGHGLPARSEKYFDLAGQLGMSSMLLYSLVTRNRASARSDLIYVLAFLWSFRLGYFLFTRFLERGEDWRFVRARHYPGFHFFTWTSQGLWCFFQGQSILALNNIVDRSYKSPALGTAFDYLGLGCWALGLGIETLADMQKLDFVRRYPERRTRPWIEEGLWAYSRHPNFFGETLTWVGIALFCLSGLDRTDTQQLAMCAFAPLFSAGFLMQTTVPWLDILADEKYGHNPEYSKYCRRVARYMLLPRRPEWL